MKGQYDSLQRSQRHLLGEDLGPLTLRELQKLERQLESALSQTRKKKTQLLLDEMEELKKKLEAAGTSDKTRKGSLEAHVAVRGSAPTSAHSSHLNAMDPEPALARGSRHLASTEAANPRNTPTENNFMQNWAL